MLIARIVVALIFFGAMAVVAKAAHIVVDLGFIPWLLAMAGIFWVGIAIENRDRAAEGRLPFSLADARRDLLGPLPGLAAVLLVAWALR